MVTAPYQIPQYLASINWKASGHICFLGAFAKAGSKCLSFPDRRQIRAKSIFCHESMLLHIFSTGCGVTHEYGWGKQMNSPPTLPPAPADNANMPFMSFWWWHVSGNQNHQGTPSAQGTRLGLVPWGGCPATSKQPRLQLRSRRGASPAFGTPHSSCCGDYVCVLQGMNKGEIFQTILM